MFKSFCFKKFCEVFHYQARPSVLKRLVFTNASTWPSQQNRWGSSNGKSRIAVILLGAVIGSGSAIGNNDLSTHIFTELSVGTA